MRIDLKKNEKLTKIITVILVGLLLIVVSVPTKSTTGSTDSSLDDSSGDDMYKACKSYEERLKQILEESYGDDTMEVMVNLVSEKETYNFTDKSETDYKVDGIFIVAHVEDETAVSDISYAVCALFDLPVHKVAVIVK